MTYTNFTFLDDGRKRLEDINTDAFVFRGDVFLQLNGTTKSAYLGPVVNTPLSDRTYVVGQLVNVSGSALVREVVLDIKASYAADPSEDF